METTFVTNIRYGDQPVKRIYLGEKLIWQCVELCSDVESVSDAKAHFYTLSLIASAGKSESVFYADSNTRVLEVELANGESKNKMHAKAAADVLKLILMESESRNKLSVKGACDVALITLMNSSEDANFDVAGNANVLNIKDIKSYAELNSDALGLANVISLINTIGNVNSDIKTSSIGTPVKIIDVASSNIERIKASGKITCLIWMNLKVIAESTSYADGIGRVTKLIMVNGKNESESFIDANCRVFHPDLMGGDCSIETKANAIYRFVSTFIMGGTGDSSSYADAFARLRKAMPNGGEAKSKFNAHSAFGKQFIFSGNGNGKFNFDNIGDMLLFYPPIGDDILLCESDGVDITVDGDVLEIRQAYYAYSSEDDPGVFYIDVNPKENYEEVK